MASTLVDNTLFRDIRYAVRSLRRGPAFTAAVVLTLGLGIGASAAMFSLVDALLLRPLPYDAPDDLVHVRALSPGSLRVRGSIPWEEARAWAASADFLDGVFLHARDHSGILYTGGAEPRRLAAEAVSPDFEEVMRVRPALGRGFSEKDADPAAEPVVVLNHDFWRSALGADSSALGRRLEIGGVRPRIVGIMPEEFKFPEYAETEMWLPLSRDGKMLGREVRMVEVLGRLRPGGLETAQASATALSTALAETWPEEMTWSARLVSMNEARARGVGMRQAMGFLSGAVALILLVAGVSAVSLLLVRVWSRTRELAVRTALGAPRYKLAGQILVESTLLALLSGAAAVVLAVGILDLIRGIMPASITFFSPYTIEVEGRTLLFTFAIAVTAGLLVGVVPAIQATRRSAAVPRAGLTPYAARTPAESRLRQGLVVGAVALSTTLLIGAGLLINSFIQLTRVDPGYRIPELAIMNLSLPAAVYPSAGERGSFVQRLEERLEALPGVEGVTAPTGGFQFGVKLQAEGTEAPIDGQPSLIPISSVTPDYFSVLEIPIRAGRAFTSEDANAGHVIIDEDLARFLWATENPVGHRFRLGTGEPWLTVVGLIGDLKLMGPDDRERDYEILYPGGTEGGGSFVSLAIRTHGDPTPLFPSIRRTVYQLNPEQPISELRTAADVYAETIDMPRFLLVLMSVLSGLALLLAAIGIHGVLAYAVARRQRDLGIRVALGARPAMLARSVLREGLALAAIGGAMGILAALALTGIIRGLLYRIEPTDPLTIGAVVTVIMAAAALASYIPAHRATRVDPNVALRAE